MSQAAASPRGVTVELSNNLPAPIANKDVPAASKSLDDGSESCRKSTLLYAFIGFVLGVILVVIIVLIMGATASSSSASTSGATNPADVQTITILHVNDIYELKANSLNLGGLARLATLRKRLAASTTDSICTLGGDVISPSALGTARIGGVSLAGRQVINILSAPYVGVDVATFGNHEFDVSSLSVLQSRIDESSFKWVSSNTFLSNGSSFPNVPRWWLWRAPTSGLQVGFVGVTINSNVKPYNRIPNITASFPLLRAAVDEVRAAGADVVVCLSHLAIASDVRVADSVPGLDIILGGHDHDNSYIRRGGNLVPIIKADSDAGTAYQIQLSFNRKTKRVNVNAQPVVINADIPEDPDTKFKIDYWFSIAFAAFAAQGFNATRPVCTITQPLDGLDSTVRWVPTLLTALTAEGIFREVQRLGVNVDLAMFNCGSCRVDNYFATGSVITEYDVLRIYPFDNKLIVVSMPGSIILRLMNDVPKLVGTGAFPAFFGITPASTGNAWLINGTLVDPARFYLVASSDFFVKVGDRGTEYITTISGNNVTELTSFVPQDWRWAFAKQLKSMFP